MVVKFLKAASGAANQAVFDLPADIEARVKACVDAPADTGSWSWSTFWDILGKYGAAVAMNVLVIVEDVVTGNYLDIVKQLAAMEPATAALVLAILQMLGIQWPTPATP